MAALNTVFRDDQWLAAIPLNKDTVLEYFSLSPWSVEDQKHADNESISYALRPVPNSQATDGLFVIERKRTLGPSDAVITDIFYCLYGSIYASPDLEQVMQARLQQASMHMARAMEAQHARTRGRER